MKVLLLGSGGREHSLAWKISQSSELEQLYIAPGNAGTKNHGINVMLNINDFGQIKSFVLENKIDLLVVGPEEPLVLGIYDYFKNDNELKNIGVIGPSKEASKLEGSKDFAKEFMMRNNVPTAKYATFTKKNWKEGLEFLEKLNPPFVLKADGLAAGKGVLIINDLKTAKHELKEILLNKKFGEAGNKIVIEEFLNGKEISFFVITDGDSYKILPEAKDYKRIGENDTGLNTGGMGAVSPVPFVDGLIREKIERQIIIPTINGLKKEKLEYKGFIFFGLILVKNEVFVIEYNCRLGDPETEVIIPRIKSDILDLFEGVVTNTLSERDIIIDEKSSATVMMVSGGYPENYEKGKTIYGLNTISNSLVFHAGTSSDGPIISTAGGRVLSITSLARTLEMAIDKCYSNVELIDFEKSYYRRDIGRDVL